MTTYATGTYLWRRPRARADAPGSIKKLFLISFGSWAWTPCAGWGCSAGSVAVRHGQRAAHRVDRRVRNRVDVPLGQAQVPQVPPVVRVVAVALAEVLAHRVLLAMFVRVGTKSSSTQCRTWLGTKIMAYLCTKKRTTYANRCYALNTGYAKVNGTVEWGLPSRTNLPGTKSPTYCLVGKDRLCWRLRRV